MTKRITLSLDSDIVEALQARGIRSLSIAANEALRSVIADDAHRAALLAWLDELNANMAHHPRSSWLRLTHCSTHWSEASLSQTKFSETWA